MIIIVSAEIILRRRKYTGISKHRKFSSESEVGGGISKNSKCCQRWALERSGVLSSNLLQPFSLFTAARHFTSPVVFTMISNFKWLPGGGGGEGRGGLAPPPLPPTPTHTLHLDLPHQHQGKGMGAKLIEMLGERGGVRVRGATPPPPPHPPGSQF